MRSLTKLTTLQLKLFFRDPTAIVFTLGFPLMLMIFFGGGANAAQERLGGLGRGDIMVPGYIGWIIATTGLMALTSALAMDRENRILSWSASLAWPVSNRGTAESWFTGRAPRSLQT